MKNLDVHIVYSTRGREVIWWFHSLFLGWKQLMPWCSSVPLCQKLLLGEQVTNQLPVPVQEWQCTHALFYWERLQNHTAHHSPFAKDLQPVELTAHAAAISFLPNWSKWPRSFRQQEKLWVSKSLQIICMPSLTCTSLKTREERQERVMKWQSYKHMIFFHPSTLGRKVDNNFSEKAFVSAVMAKGANSLKMFCHLQL